MQLWVNVQPETVNHGGSMAGGLTSQPLCSQVRQADRSPNRQTDTQTLGKTEF